ncbi:MAG: Uncharacterised protein [Candidatus Nitrosopelagicus brevis]|nr:MAG: Uncharacterised protein [Candidatus Nitrosopelagicus brevis]
MMCNTSLSLLRYLRIFCNSKPSYMKTSLISCAFSTLVVEFITEESPHNFFSNSISSSLAPYSENGFLISVIRIFDNFLISSRLNSLKTLFFISTLIGNFSSKNSVNNSVLISEIAGSLYNMIFFKFK